MEEKYRPYIIYLTGIQEQELWQHIKQNSWKITVFKGIHKDLQFLVDLLIEDKDVDLAVIKDSVFHSTTGRYEKRRKNETNGTKLVRKKTCTDTEGSEQYTFKEEMAQDSTDKGQNEISMNCETFVENAKKSTSTNFNKGNFKELPDENLQELLVKDNPEISKDITNCQEIENKEDKAKETTRMSARVVHHRQRKYRLKKLANKSDRMSQFGCEICGKVAASEKYLQRHIEKIHSLEAQRRKMEEKRKKQDQEINVCHICRKQFADKYALTAHRLNIHSEKRDVYQCDLCGAILKQKGSLVQHKKTVHSDQRPYKCDICASEFKLYQQLKTHKRRHDPDFVETCMICGKTLKKGHLTTHMKRHSNDRKFKCDKCGKTFFEKQDLERHAILHSGEKPNKCPHCSYACAFKGNLTKHIKVRHQTDICLHELQDKKKYARLKCSPKGKIETNRDQSNKRFLLDHLGTGNYNPPQSKLSKEETGHFSSMQQVNRGVTENFWTFSGNNPKTGNMKRVYMAGETEFNEGIQRQSVPAVQVFSDTDSQSKSFTADSNLHILKPVQHGSEQLVNNLSGLDQDTSNTIDFRESY